MFKKTRILTKVLNCFTSTTRSEDEAVNNVVERTYRNHIRLQRTLGSSAPSIEKMTRKVLGEVLFNQEGLGLARIKRESLPIAIQAYGEFAHDVKRSTMLRTGT